MKNVLILIGFLSLGFVAALALRSEVPDVGNNLQPTDSPLRVELQAKPLVVRYINANGEPVCILPLFVRFTNMSKEPVYILKALDGSEWCWIMPHYKLTICDASSHEIPLQSRCGNFGLYNNTTWPSDCVVKLKPSRSYERYIWPIHDVTEEGIYTLRFEYRFTPVGDQLPGNINAPFFLMYGQGLTYPPNLWRGTAVSNTIVVLVPKSR